MFDTVRLDGTQVHFPADLAGKPVAIRFWADWCQYCEGAMKDIEVAFQRHKAAGIELRAVNAGQDRATAAAFVANQMLHDLNEIPAAPGQNTQDTP